MQQANLFQQPPPSEASTFSEMQNPYYQTIAWNDILSGKVASQIKEAARNEKLSSSDSVYNVMKPIFAKEDDVEQMYGIFLTRKNQIISIDLLARGSISGAAVYPREIIKMVLEKKAAGLVLSHNHPSGDPSPSPEDFSLTKQVMAALTCVGAQLLDHVVVGNQGASYSLGDSGILVQFRTQINESLLFKPKL